MVADAKPQASRRSSPASERVREIYESTTRSETQRDQELKEIVPKLANRAYHLEKGNTWWQDWKQYQMNTHPVYGICCHHPLHPINGMQRFIILIGSIAFGLAITNMVYLGFLRSDQAGTAVNLAYDKFGDLSESISQFTSIDVDQSFLFLCTVGSFLHAAFDSLVWELAACTCFRPGGVFGQRRFFQFFQNWGLYLSVLLIIGAVIAATSVVILRLDANITVEDQSTQILEEAGIENTKFSFLLAYALELVFALFVFYFITSTVLFSGILGCGRIPVLGGRPYELRQEARELTESQDTAEMNESGGEDTFEEEGVEVIEV
jgi:hypothetical protein